MEADKAIEGMKLASFLNHLKNNRIEYLVLVMLAHAVGITAKITEQTNGMCL
jgi:hypothetical protein